MTRAHHARRAPIGETQRLSPTQHERESADNAGRRAGRPRRCNAERLIANPRRRGGLSMAKKTAKKKAGGAKKGGKKR